MPPNPQNLKPRPAWPKGVSGNPKGRPPKGAAFADLMAMIDELPGSRRALSKVWFKEMLKGNFQFFREYLERSDGKTPLAAEEQAEQTAEDFGILVRVPTVRQAERKAKAKAKQKAKRKPARGKPDGTVAG